MCEFALSRHEDKFSILCQIFESGTKRRGLNIYANVWGKCFTQAHKAGRRSIAWSDIVTLALSRLQNVDPVSATRLAANYTDETGAVRFDRSATEQPSPQLGLPLIDADD